MKTLSMLLLLAGLAVALAGCGISATPAYSGQERYDQIGDYWALDWQELADDTDHALLLRPSDTLTMWDIYHRN